MSLLCDSCHHDTLQAQTRGAATTSPTPRPEYLGHCPPCPLHLDVDFGATPSPALSPTPTPSSNRRGRPHRNWKDPWIKAVGVYWQADLGSGPAEHMELACSVLGASGIIPAYRGCSCKAAFVDNIALEALHEQRNQWHKSGMIPICVGGLK